tara:strand:- start:1654 stop:3054 length:1401 start_codon:yes stop_codon:yes gene_type:complete
VTEIIQSVLGLLVTFSILITVHELGHYWVARFFGVHVLRFSVGFGRPIYRKVFGQEDLAEGLGDNEPQVEPTEFVVSSIPLGGYVKFLDEREQNVPPFFLEQCYNRKNVWQRIAIAAAGPLANFVLAIFCYWLLFVTGITGVSPVLGKIDSESLAWKSGLREGQKIVEVDYRRTFSWSDVNVRLLERLGETGEIEFTVLEKNSTLESVYSVPISDWLSSSDEPNPAVELGLSLDMPEYTPKIGGMLADGRAKSYGLEIGDEIKMIDGNSISSWKEFVKIVQLNPENELILELERSGVRKSLSIRPEARDRNGKRIGFIGASPEPMEFPESRLVLIKYSVFKSLEKAIEKTWDVIWFTLDAFKKMLEGVISTKNLSGPITIAQVANSSAESGILSFISFIALLSVSLGVVNLLPIPMLDGGHLLYYFIEVVMGKPLPERVQAYAAQVGIFMLLGIMTIAIYNDISRL